RSAEHPGVRRAARIARWTDVRLIDPLLGLLLPGAGDLVSAGIGLYIVGVAARLRVPPVVIARMLLNLGVDALVGAIPLLGDLFDFAWQANRRNVALLEQRGAGGRSRPTDWLVVIGAALLLLVALAVPVIALVLVLRRVL